MKRFLDYRSFLNETRNYVDITKKHLPGFTGHEFLWSMEAWIDRLEPGDVAFVLLYMDTFGYPLQYDTKAKKDQLTSAIYDYDDLDAAQCDNEDYRMKPMITFGIIREFSNVERTDVTIRIAGTCNLNISPGEPSTHEYPGSSESIHLDYLDFHLDNVYYGKTDEEIDGKRVNALSGYTLTDMEILMDKFMDTHIENTDESTSYSYSASIKTKIEALHLGKYTGKTLYPNVFQASFPVQLAIRIKELIEKDEVVQKRTIGMLQDRLIPVSVAPHVLPKGKADDYEPEIVLGSF